jgi:hypothetical protein
MVASLRQSDLDDAEIERRSDQLLVVHWRVLDEMRAEPVALKQGGKLARAAWELQQLAFVWPKRSPWWAITKHGLRALALRDARLKSAQSAPNQSGETT